MHPALELAGRLRDEADLLRRRGLEREARMEESIAGEIELALRAHDLEELTVADAALESGYSERRLRELVREGKIPDHRPADSQGEIRIRRCDLPRKPAGDRSPVQREGDIGSRLLAARRGLRSRSNAGSGTVARSAPQRGPEQGGTDGPHR
jgi:hypothetical protein